MTSKIIIESCLKFLVEEFKMEYFYKTDKGKEFYCYQNLYGSFTYCERKQFGEFEFIVTDNENGKKYIKMNEKYPHIIGAFNYKYRGLRNLFKDKTEAYWIMIANILRQEITSTGFLYGLKVQ